jgi:hypothetical protein
LDETLPAGWNIEPEASMMMASCLAMPCPPRQEQADIDGFVAPERRLRRIGPFQGQTVDASRAAGHP